MLRSVLIASACLWLLLVGCVLTQRSSESLEPITASTGSAEPVEHQVSPRVTIDRPFRAVGLQVQRMDWMEEYKRSIDEIAALGADTVKLVVDARQENGASTRMYLDVRMTPTSQMLGDLIDHAKAKGLRVILMPIVLLDAPRNNEWRGTLRPESWDQWFKSYRDILTHFAIIAQCHGVDVFCVGSELVSSESQEKQWQETIAHVRSIYHGLLTYSSNWDRYDQLPFWSSLDLIGMNSYWALGQDSNVSIETIESNWKIHQRAIGEFSKKMGKPVLLTEVGWCSLANAAHEPWDYTKDVAIDLDLQARLYAGFFNVWPGTPWLAGFSIWEWKPDGGGPDDKGYTPKGKPAEKVLRDALAKPAWDVRQP